MKIDIDKEQIKFEKEVVDSLVNVAVKCVGYAQYTTFVDKIRVLIELFDEVNARRIGRHIGTKKVLEIKGCESCSGTRYEKYCPLLKDKIDVAKIAETMF